MSSTPSAKPSRRRPGKAGDQLPQPLRSLPPLGGTPESLAERARASLAEVAPLVPAGLNEARMIEFHNLAVTLALGYLDQARQQADDPTEFRRLMKLATTVLGDAKGWRATLVRLQAMRKVWDATPASSARAIMIETRGCCLMKAALAEPKPGGGLPPDDPQIRAMMRPGWQPDAAAQADVYARLHRNRARLIRRLGRLPRDCDFSVPADVVQAIVTGTSPALLALDPNGPGPR